jgi:DNA topoisomerase-2
MFRVSTNRGIVDVTEDHSKLDSLSEKISPKDLVKGSKLLHLNKFQTEMFVPRTHVFIPLELFFMGVFFMNGHIVNKKIVIHDCAALFPQYKEHFNGLFELHGTDIVSEDSTLIRYYRRYLYYKNSNIKCIDDDILNSDDTVRRKFYEGTVGFYNGTFHEKITMHSYYILCTLLNKKVHCSFDPIDLNCYYLKIIDEKDESFSKDLSKNSDIIVTDIVELPLVEQYVYDLETSNHHFQAGVGSIVVHNTDGYHIKGLLMNFLTKNWPELVKESFITSLLTPIVKVTMSNKDIVPFYNLNDYEDFKNKNKDSIKKIKYYKGLGTSTDKEAMDYFKDIDNNMLHYLYDKKRDEPMLELAFNDTLADNRKKWISDSIKNIEQLKVSYTEKNISISSFINKELVQFSIYDNQRSIPNVMDGLKISQRKVLYASIKKNLYKEEIKVGQLSSYVSETTDYHHGEKSLESTIVNMAQNFVGSNNINLFEPIGQFGSRNEGGSDAASSRYIFTKLCPYVSSLFNKLDFPLLSYHYDDTYNSIEPKYYVPIIPMILVNGTEGIGTGYSTNFPCYKPSVLIENIKYMLNNEPCKRMIPWYRGFTGSIVEVEPDRKWVSRGLFKKEGRRVTVTELPVGLWTDVFIEKVLKNAELVSSYEDKTTTTNPKDSKNQKKKTTKKTSKKTEDNDVSDLVNSICFEIILANDMTDEEFIKKFKMETSISGTNMVAFNPDEIIHKYEDTSEIMVEFYNYRLHMYERRRLYMIEELQRLLKLLESKVRFIEYIISKKLLVFRVPKKDIIESLKNLKFDLIDESYNYLLDMNIASFSMDTIDKFNNEIMEHKKEVDRLLKTTNKDLYREDLQALELLL